MEFLMWSAGTHRTTLDPRGDARQFVGLWEGKAAEAAAPPAGPEAQGPLVGPPGLDGRRLPSSFLLLWKDESRLFGLMKNLADEAAPPR